MNDGLLSDDDDGDEGSSESYSDSEIEEDLSGYLVPKSKSTPNLSGKHKVTKCKDQ